MIHTSRFNAGRYVTGRFNQADPAIAEASFSVSIQGLTDNPTHGSTAQIGTTLSATAAEFSAALPSSINWQWHNSSGPIVGATADTYVPTATDDLETIHVVATASDGYGATVSETQTVRHAPPVASGTLKDRNMTWQSADTKLIHNVGRKFDGEALSLSASGYVGAYVAGAKLRINPITEVTNATVTVSATNSGGTANIDFDLTVEALRFLSAELVGPGDIGSVHTASASVNRKGAEMSFEFLRDGQPIDAADQATYTPSAADAGTDLSVEISATLDGVTVTTEPAGIAVAELAPIAVGTLPDVSYSGQSGAQSIAAAAGFTGTGIVYSIVSALPGASIDAATGVVTVPTESAGSGLIEVIATNSGGSASQSFRVDVIGDVAFAQGWDPDIDLGTNGDFFVDALNGSDGNDGQSSATAFATLTHALSVGGGGKTYRVMGNGVRYREMVRPPSGISETARTEILGYGQDKPILTGAEAVTGWTQCSSADVEVLGTVLGVTGSPVFKASIPRAAAVLPDDGDKLNIHENGEKSNLCLDWAGTGRDDPFFQQSIEDWHSADEVHLVNLQNQYGTWLDHIDGYRLDSVTDRYTKAQIERMWLHGYTSGNWAFRSDVSRFDPATKKIKLATPAGYYERAANADRFALFNALPNMQQGQWGYVVNGDVFDVYLWPNDPANLAGGVEYSARPQIFMARGVSNLRIAGIDGRQAAGKSATSFNGTVMAGGCFFEANDLGASQNVTIEHCRISGCIGAGKYGTVHVAMIDNFLFKNNSLNNILGFRGINCSGYAPSSPNEHQTVFALENHIDRNTFRRVEWTPFRGTGLRDSLATHNYCEECCFETHNNKTNVYQQTHNFLWFGNLFIDVGGFLTWQQSTAVSGGFNYLFGDYRGGTDTQNRTIADQNGGVVPADYIGAPDDTMHGFWFNNTILPTPVGVAGTASDSFAITAGSLGDSLRYKVYNNIYHGYAVSGPSQIREWKTNWDTKPDPDGTFDPSDHQSSVEDTFVDALRDNFRIRQDADIRTAVGTNLTAVIADLSGRFGHMFSDWTLDPFGDTIDLRSPPMGASVNYKYPAQIGPLPAVPSAADWSVSTGGDAGQIAIEVIRQAVGKITNYEYTTDGGVTWQTLGGNDLGTYTIETQSDGAAMTEGSTHSIALRTANKSGHSQASDTKQATTGTAAGFIPQWIQWPTTQDAGLSNPATMTGGSTGVTRVTHALAFRFPVGDVGSDRRLMQSQFSTNYMWNVSKNAGETLTFGMENASNARVFYRYTSSPLQADTDYLMLQSYDAAAGVSSMVVIELATGAVIDTVNGQTVGNTTLDTTGVPNVIGGLVPAGSSFTHTGRLERVQMWDDTYVDVTDPGVQGYFYDSAANVLKSPTVAIGPAGLNAAPLVSIVGTGLLTGRNGGTGGNFVKSGPGVLTVHSGTSPSVAAPVNTASPLVTPSGDVHAGTLLASASGTWSGYPAPTYAYQWERGSVPIPEATGAAYTTAVDDVGTAITCEVTAMNSEGSASRTSNAVTVSATTGGGGEDALAGVGDFASGTGWALFEPDVTITGGVLAINTTTNFRYAYLSGLNRVAVVENTGYDLEFNMLSLTTPQRLRIKVKAYDASNAVLGSEAIIFDSNADGAVAAGVNSKASAYTTPTGAVSINFTLEFVLAGFVGEMSEVKLIAQ